MSESVVRNLNSVVFPLKELVLETNSFKIKSLLFSLVGTGFRIFQSTAGCLFWIPIFLIQYLLSPFSDLSCFIS